MQRLVEFIEYRIWMVRENSKNKLIIFLFYFVFRLIFTNISPVNVANEILESWDNNNQAKKFRLIG